MKITNMVLCAMLLVLVVAGCNNSGTDTTATGTNAPVTTNAMPATNH